MRQVATAVAVALVAAGGAAAAQSPFALVSDPAEVALLPEASEALTAPKPDLARLDALLARLPRPLPLRGLVQLRRGEMLSDANRHADGLAATEEALRILPDQPFVMLVASAQLTFMGAPQRAADLWIAASRADPAVALQSDAYVLSALIGRLQDLGDRRRADALSARMAEIGYAQSLAPERAETALAAARDAFRVSGTSAAEPLLARINTPEAMRALYVDRRFVTLWPAIERSAGEDLGLLNAAYLRELRGEWEAANDFATARNYARALAEAGAYPAVVALFGKMVEDYDGGDEDGLPFLTPIVARSLANMGRLDEAEALVARVAARYPAGSPAMSLNFDGARITLAVARRQWPVVVKRTTDFLAVARQQGDGVNRSALLNVTALRACALLHLSRRGDAAHDIAQVVAMRQVAPMTALVVYSCTNDVADARALLLEMLADENRRDVALDYLQPPGRSNAQDLPGSAAIHAAMRADPAVRAAIARVGRVLPVRIENELPPGFDPLRPSRPVRIGPDVA